MSHEPETGGGTTPDEDRPTGEPRRLHRAGIAVYALAALREAAFPLLALFAVAVLGGGLDAEALARGAAFAVIGLVGSTIMGYWRWSTTTWRVSADGIHHRRGLVSIKETDVPLGRIQALDLEQGPVQRLFGVQALHVQTGGGGARGEIVLEAVGEDDVRALRAFVAASHPETAATEPRPVTETRLTRGRLLVAALTAGQIGVLLPVLAGAAQLAESVAGDDASSIRVEIDGVGQLVLIGAALLGAAWLLSVLGAVVAFGGFTAARDGDRLRIRRGLVQRREATIPVPRVRAVKVVEGLLRRPFGLATLRIEVIGHAKEPAAAQTLFPILRLAEVRPFLDRLLPELADELGDLARPPRRALRRYVLPPAAIGLAAGAAAWAFTPAGPWALLAAVPPGAYGALRFRAAGWRLAGGRLAVRSLMLARTTVLAPAVHRESHAIAQNVLQRRAELADVAVAFGKSTNARVRHLDAGTATKLWERLSAA
jgi:putative membrane protein